MRKLALYGFFILMISTLTSCEAVGTIFEAGMWWGIILVVGILALIVWMFSRGRSK